MAQVLLQSAFDRKGLRVVVSSAGIRQFVANDMHHYAREVLDVHGFAITPRRPRLISDELVQSAHLVLVMEEGHRRWLIKRYPASRHKVMLFNGVDRTDVPDPMGQDKQAFERLYDLIWQLSEAWPDRLVSMGLIGQSGPS